MLINPVLGERKSSIIPHMTTTEIKFGAYVIVWTVLRNLRDGTEFNNNAKIIGIGNPASNEYKLNENVFPIICQADAELKNRRK